MDFTILLIGLGVIIAIIIVGKILKIVTKILFTIILIILIAIGAFWTFNNFGSTKDNKTGFYSFTMSSKSVSLPSHMSL